MARTRRKGGKPGQAEAERTLRRCSRAGGAPVQDRAVREDGWTGDRREIFLNVIAQTCNLSHAAKACGMHVSSAYRLRARDAAFRDAWEDALEQAYTALEMAVVQECLAGSVTTTTIREGGEKYGRVKETRTVQKRDLTAAIQLLRLHRASVTERRAKMAAAGADSAALTRDILAKVEQARAGFTDMDKDAGAGITVAARHNGEAGAADG
ncbi:hypothetical protein KFK14_02015 [Sphingobium phenoxybenzoativorans]|uniref:Terminase small subunit n=1 Tax=Sphingobium phenoxybenzoativorans TaxID=1592790 RepID=A0A975K7M3_9SPHN|nr:hypothetical protein [Sphingobium phenoxybenzoativorans]QUT06284.1 hypothetical protein KFK14_02015 [Sphingobium phenoxybenzoativorans]